MTIVRLLAIGYLLLAAPPALAFFHTDTGPSGLAPLQQDLQDEIKGIGQQGALVGIGPAVLDDIDVRLFAMRIVRVALGLVGIVLIAFIIYGGFLYMTSQGNEEKVTTAKKVLGRAGVGALIIIFSFGIVKFVSINLQRAIFRQSLVQAQSCTTSTGQATCCDEWNAYQAAQAEVTSAWDALGRATQLVEREEALEREVNEAYDKWQDCFEKAQEEAFSFGD